jgi:hypothetical protein
MDASASREAGGSQHHGPYITIVIRFLRQHGPKKIRLADKLFHLGIQWLASYHLTLVVYDSLIHQPSLSLLPLPWVLLVDTLVWEK